MAARSKSRASSSDARRRGSTELRLPFPCRFSERSLPQTANGCSRGQSREDSHSFPHARRTAGVRNHVCREDDVGTHPIPQTRRAPQACGTTPAGSVCTEMHPALTGASSAEPMRAAAHDALHRFHAPRHIRCQRDPAARAHEVAPRIIALGMRAVGNITVEITGRNAKRPAGMPCTCRPLGFFPIYDPRRAFALRRKSAARSTARQRLKVMPLRPPKRSKAPVAFPKEIASGACKTPRSSQRDRGETLTSA